MGIQDHTTDWLRQLLRNACAGLGVRIHTVDSALSPEGLALCL